MSDNIMTIIKETAPYLYLTDDSGIYQNLNSISMVDVAINPDYSSNYQLAAIQLWIRIKSVINAPIATLTTFAIRTIDAEDLGDGRSVVSCTEPCKMYVSGYETQYAYLVPNEWTALTIVFDEPIWVGGMKGSLLLHPGVLFNNIALFSDETGSIGSRAWPETNIYDALVGTSTLVVEDKTTIRAFSNGLDVFTDVRWQTVEKPII